MHRGYQPKSLELGANTFALESKVEEGTKGVLAKKGG